MNALLASDLSAPISALSVPQADVNAALRVAAAQVVGLLRAIPDANLPIPRSEWTVAETAIHLMAGARVYLRCARGEPGRRP
jgi:hypothetical protein